MFAVRKRSDGVDVGSYSVTVTEGPIMNSDELKETSERLGIPMPEMVFGKTRVLITNSQQNFEIKFDAVDALDLVDKKNDPVKVACAEEWSKHRQQTLSDQQISEVQAFDWTYTTSYKGTLGPSTMVASTKEKIDYDRLKQPDPILFFHQGVLFEDELADHGSAMLSYKVRVMPSCAFVLVRLFVRVDNVLVRIHDTRCFVDFASKKVIREHTQRADSIVTHPKPPGAGPEYFHDEQNMSQVLPVVHESTDLLQGSG